MNRKAGALVADGTGGTRETEEGPMCRPNHERAQSARRGIETLGVLNEKARALAYGIEDLDWARPLQRDRLWSPPDIAPLVHLPSFARLSPTEARRYNQLFAVGVCEQFVWFEQHLLCPILRRLLAQVEIPAELREALEIFIEEENKHSEMFWRMCEKAEPQFYPTRRFRLFNTSRLQDAAVAVMLRHPRTFLVWIWAVIFFEERTVDYCRQYLRTARAQPDLLDPSFVELHEFHMKDEGRHFQLDQHLLTWLYDPAPRWKRALAGRMFRQLMRAYVSPRRTSWSVLEVLGQEFPHLQAEVLPALRRELPLLRTNRSFHQAAFSRQAVGHSMALFTEYPEMDALWDLFVVEGKQGARA